MSQVIFQQNEIAYLKFLDEFNTAYQQYALTQQKVGTLEKLKIKLQQAEQKLKFMQIEFGSCSPQLKAELTPKLKQHKMTYADCMSKLKGIEQQKQNDESQQTQASMDTRRRAEQVTNSLNNQSNTLHHLNSKLEETANLGDHMLGELHNQKKKLLEAEEDTNVIRSDVKTTGGLIKLMQNRELFNKSLKAGLVCVLTLGNLLLIYYKYVS